MKKTCLGALLLLLTLLATTQSYAIADPTVNGPSISPAPAIYPNPNYPNAGLSTFQFQIANVGTSTSSSAVTVTISLTKLDFNDGTFDVATDLEQVGTTVLPFTWSWDAVNNTLTGTLNGLFPEDEGNLIRIKNLVVTASSDSTVPNIGGNINIVAPGAVNQFTTNDNVWTYTYSVPPPVVLPVTLQSFEARKESGCRAGLNWTVADVLNFSHFEVEQSADGLDFLNVGMVAWKKGQADYSLVADQPMNKGYYRLKMVDKDKAYKYSDVKMLTLNCSGGADVVSLYPNPVEKSRGYTLEYNSATTGTARYTVADVTGKVYEQRLLPVATGNNHYTLSTAGMAAGTYYVQLHIVGTQSPYTLKLLVK